MASIEDGEPAYSKQYPINHPSNINCRSNGAFIRRSVHLGDLVTKPYIALTVHLHTINARGSRNPDPTIKTHDVAFPQRSPPFHILHSSRRSPQNHNNICPNRPTK